MQIMTNTFLWNTLKHPTNPKIFLMTILEEKAASQKTSSTSSRKSVSEDDNRSHLEKGGIVGSPEINLNHRNSIGLDETLIRALTTSNSSAMISAVGDRYITPEYLAPLPSSSVSFYEYFYIIQFERFFFFFVDNTARTALLW